MAFEDWGNFTRAEKQAFLASNTDAIISEFAWSYTTLTYSFLTNPAGWYDPAQVPQGQSLNFAPLTAFQQDFVRALFDYISSFTNLEFVEVGGNSADIGLGRHEMISAGYGYFPDETFGSGVFIANDGETSHDTLGDFWSILLTHEIGHALGLTHPRPYDNEYRGTDAELAAEDDSGVVTTLTYSDLYYYPDFGVTGGYPWALRPLDIAALQEVYGVRASSGTITYVLTDAPDTLPSLDGATWTIPIDYPFVLQLTPGAEHTVDLSQLPHQAPDDPYYFSFDYGLFAPAEAALEVYNVDTGQWGFLTPPYEIELLELNATGAPLTKAIGGGGSEYVFGDQIEMNVETRGGQDTIVGGTGDDHLDGGDDDDTIAIGLGNDTAMGGAGDDFIILDLGSDGGVSEIDGGTGRDQVYEDHETQIDTFGGDVVYVDLNTGTRSSGNSATLNMTSIEKYYLVGDKRAHFEGSDIDNVLITGGLEDTVAGGLGHDTLAGGAGADLMSGGDGNDLLFGDADFVQLSNGIPDHLGLPFDEFFFF